MTTRLILVVGCGAGVGAGLLMIGLGSRPAAGPRHGWSRRDTERAAGAAVVAVLVLVATRWVAVAAALGGLVYFWPRLFGGVAAAKAATARLEALAGWAESLRDLTAAGVALPDALLASVPAAAAPIRPQLAALAERVGERVPLPEALGTLADELDDQDADLIVAALILNAHAQGRQLVAVLSALARSARAQLEVRRKVEADRRGTRRGVLIVMAVTITVGLGLALLNPGYVAPYRAPAGQLMLAVIVAVFTFGFGWLRRLSAPQPVVRLLGPSARGTPR
ncbi:MAG TPA: type II secretion system F family protein [Mycobacteriales bacterium]|nr:type II secretion system F family protein [Mycobacteriales bacterium]